MTGYKIYLTKSCEVASLLFAALQGNDEVSCAGYGAVSKNCLIPEIYHESGWFYAYAEYHDLENPMYEIVFA